MKLARSVAFIFLALLLSQGAFADPTGRIRGKVKNREGEPIDKVTLLIEGKDEVPASYKATTNSKGEYIHIGIRPGNYRITPSKEGYVPVEYGYIELRVSLSDKPAVADFVMAPKAPAQAANSPTPNQQQPAQNADAQKGMALLNSGKNEEAIAAFTKAIEANPTNPILHHNLGIAYEKKDDSENAQKHFQEAIRLKPDFGQAYLALGNSYMTEKKYEEAIAALKKATELMPQSYEAFYNLGACYMDTQKYGDGEASFRKATELAPKEPIAHYQLGMALYSQSKNADAKAEFQKYLELNPNAADKAEVEQLIQTL